MPPIRIFKPLFSSLVVYLISLLPIFPCCSTFYSFLPHFRSSSPLRSTPQSTRLQWFMCSRTYILYEAIIPFHSAPAKVLSVSSSTIPGFPTFLQSSNNAGYANTTRWLTERLTTSNFELPTYQVQFPGAPFPAFPATPAIGLPKYFGDLSPSGPFLLLQQPWPFWHLWHL